ncbi:Periplasmic protein [Rickettsia canadensis str. McKiel]|uniref:Periplasmic protein n=1 Tax=Rickettsia canadensis (strain McKiel) TaxID=293613 RepID=A8EZT2_RICCK|nr:M23 family metallopeptidase [Rickettsia canadensis]ABV73865.1 Periplasmic protein [Rickettsia canadensis str. McKiel]
MFFRKYIFLLFIVFLVQGCSSIKVSSDTTLLSTTLSQLKQKYKISHADLVVQYDLANKNSKCIYAKNLGLIINNPKQNKMFLQKLHNKNLAEFNKAVAIKIADIKALITKLNSKYQFLSKPVASYFAQKQTHGSNISELTKLDKIIATIPLLLPEYEPKITSHYGTRKSPHKKKRKKKCFHSGIDLQAKKAAPIYAAASGVVIKVARASDYGNFVEIKHGHKFITKYAHLKEIQIKEGNKIKRGQLIGIQGRTGNATGEHLHFEILLDNKAINPFDFIFNCRKC